MAHPPRPPGDGPDDLEAADAAGEPVPLPVNGVLDLHTFRPAEVGELVPAWVGACAEAGLRELRIVHGKGTGALRRSVHALLARDPRVASYRLADEDAGGWGATLVALR
jgi:DNA-nicking Smr family endonuclease